MKTTEPTIATGNKAEFEINDAEQNCIDTKDHQAKIEVHFAPSEGETGRENAKQLAKRIVTALSMHDGLIERLKYARRFLSTSVDVDYIDEILNQVKKK